MPALLASLALALTCAALHPAAVAAGQRSTGFPEATTQLVQGAAGLVSSLASHHPLPSSPWRRALFPQQLVGDHRAHGADDGRRPDCAGWGGPVAAEAIGGDALDEVVHRSPRPSVCECLALALPLLVFLLLEVVGYHRPRSRGPAHLDVAIGDARLDLLWKIPALAS